MRTRTRVPLHIALLGGALTLALASGPASPALAVPPAITLSPRAALDPAVVSATVDYLTGTYGVGAPEAMRRLEVQRFAPELAQALGARFPDSYAGMWIDQDRGGFLVVNAVDPVPVRLALRGITAHHPIQVREVKHSLQALNAEVAAITAQFGDVATVDEVNDIVVVHLRSARALRQAHGAVDPVAADPVALARDVAARAGSGLVRLDDSVEARYPDCSLTDCQPPMRGGAELDLYPGPGYCTNGFNLHGSNGWQYTITAGHCFDSGSTRTKHGGQWVGYVDNPTAVSDLYPYDAAIMPYLVTGGNNYAVYWLTGNPKNRVWATNLSNALFPIYGMYTYSQIGVGWAVCTSGAASGSTRCGLVKGKDGGIVTDICVRKGDSGAPLYSQVDNKAYAILSQDPTPDDSCPSGFRSYFSSLSKVFDSAKTTSGITFGVNTV